MAKVEAGYVCHRAANAIITQVDPLHVSTDALQAINHFLDEFLVLLIGTSRSLDLSRIKAAVLALLPASLGKNAIVEAELEVKELTESTESIDYDAYEQLRSFDHVDVDTVLSVLRQMCMDYCTLSEYNHQREMVRPADRTSNRVYPVTISPIVAVYVSTIVEHIAEYLLTVIAITAEHDRSDSVRVKQVFVALNDDFQVGGLFRKMSIRDRLEKRVSVLGYQQKPPLPSPTTGSHALYRKSIRDSNVSTFDDALVDLQEPASPPFSGTSESLYSIKSNNTHPDRPVSIMSSSTSTNTISSFASSSSKKGFRLFKKRSSLSETTPVSLPPQPRMSVSVCGPESHIDFEDLMRSGDTVRVSLTPNRLRSIEVMREYSAIEDTESTTSVDPPPLPSKPAFTKKKLSLTEPAAPFENPRAAPRPPPPVRHFHDTNTAQRSMSHVLPSPAPASKADGAPRRRPQAKTPRNELERPSSMAVKRASMISSRPVSYHENFALHYNDGHSSITPSSTPNQPRPSLSHPNKNLDIETPSQAMGVRDKVRKFERPKPAEVPASEARRDRLLGLLKQEPPLQPSSLPSSPVAVDASVQTDTPQNLSVADTNSSEAGVVEGDEEWFILDEVWEDESTVVEWLLGS